MNQTFQKIVGGVLAVTALMGLSACGSKTEDNKADGKTYKVGIVQFVDDASLNQIEAAIEAELDAKATELGVKFDYTLYNGQADGTTLNISSLTPCNGCPGILPFQAALTGLKVRSGT